MGAVIDSKRSLPPTAAMDVLAISTLFIPGVLAFGPVFGGYAGYLAAGGGVLAGLTVATVSAARQWTRLGTISCLLATYLLLGGPLALPDSTIGGVIPTLETLQRLVVLITASWRDLLTVSLPAGEFSGPAVVPFLSGLVLGSLTLSIAWRTRLAGLVVIGPMALLLVGILWGGHGAPWAQLQGALMAAVSLGWLSWRARAGAVSQSGVFSRHRPPASVRWHRPVTAAAVMATAMLVGALMGPGAFDGQPRLVLRDKVVPPLDLTDYASPLTLYRYLETDLEEEVLFEISDLRPGERIRLATMDQYDGHVFNVTEQTGGFMRAGRSIAPGATSVSAKQAEALKRRVVIKAYQGVWLPGGGDLRGVEFIGPGEESRGEGLHYNSSSGTALTTAGLSQGATYDVEIVPQSSGSPAPAAAPLAAPLPANAGVPDAVSGAVGDLVGDSDTPLGQLTSLAEQLRKVGFFSDGQEDESPAGHSTGRLANMFESAQIVGDDEQYAVAMALMVNELDIPARVVMGFYPDDRKVAAGGPIAITGADAHVWVEVPFEGHGWVTFDPTPDEDKTPDQSTPQPQERNDPQVLPPPEIPEEREPSQPAKAEADDDDRKDEESSSLLTLLLAALVVGAVAALLLLPFVLIILLKNCRRRRRRLSDRRSDRISGGWAELLDLAADMGRRVPSTLTRSEAVPVMMGTPLAAAPGQDAAAPSAEELDHLAVLVDGHVFGGSEITDAQVATTWSEVHEARRSMLRDMPRWRRWRCRLSLRSLARPADRGALPRRHPRQATWVRRLNPKDPTP